MNRRELIKSGIAALVGLPFSEWLPSRTKKIRVKRGNWQHCTDKEIVLGYPVRHVNCRCSIVKGVEWQPPEDR